MRLFLSMVIGYILGTLSPSALLSKLKKKIFATAAPET